MNISETFFLIIMGTVLLTWFVCATIWDTSDSKKYKQYIDSIKVGDKFMMCESFDEDVNPFEERPEPMIAEIIDIRTNKIGKKYVQYRYINDPQNLTYNNDIDTFIVMREKITN